MNFFSSNYFDKSKLPTNAKVGPSSTVESFISVMKGQSDSVLLRENEGLRAKLAAMTAENERLRSLTVPASTSSSRLFGSKRSFSSKISHPTAGNSPARENLRWAKISDLGAEHRLVEEEEEELSNSDDSSDSSGAHESDLKDFLKNVEGTTSPLVTSLEDSFSSAWTTSNPEDLTGAIVRDSVYPAHGGGFADVYVGTLTKNGLATKVAVKVIRAHTYTETNQWKIDKRLRREIRVWSLLRHPNVVPLLGTTMSFGRYTAMVCPWMNEGNLNHYLNEKKPKLNLRRRLQILSDVVEGLSYLHAQPFVHGDLTTGNILVDDGKAHLSDFGLSNVMAEVRSNSFNSSTVGGAPRWTAPELFHFGADHNQVPEVTRQCDIYSFGSVALQVISGRIPYEDILNDIHVMMELMKGRNPPRPPEPLLSDDFWNFIVLCWERDPFIRPEIDQVREMLQVLRYSCSEERLAANVVDADIPSEIE